jgi:glycosyltransferase involved in cell wall biosynthesis
MTAARILFTIPNFQTAGSGRALFEVVRRLDRRRFEPWMCVAQRGGRLELEIAAAGIPVLEAPFTVDPRPLGTLWRRAAVAAETFRPYGFAIWHSSHYLDDYTEPLVARQADAAFVFTKKNMSWNRRSWLLRGLLARRIAAQNTDMLEHFFSGPFWARGAWRRRVRLVPRGVDTERFAPAPVPRRPGPRLRLGNVANLVPVKGLETLVAAVARVPGVELEIAGRADDAAYADDLRRQAAELGAPVQLCGAVADVPAFLRGLDLFALPTHAKGRMEGCPVALLEAMACGLPVLASDIPGARDLVEPERSGLLLPPGDVGAWAAALTRLQASPALRAELGAAARRRVCERFPIELEVARHEALYLEILGEDPGPRARQT